MPVPALLRDPFLALIRQIRRCVPDATTANLALRDERERLGFWGENLAAAHLQAHGYRIVGRRVRLGRDEIDMIAVPSGSRTPQLVFVEVKTRRSARFGAPIEAINRRKRHALCRAAIHYLRRLAPPTPRYRFDAIEIIGGPDVGKPVLRHTENAFPMESRIIPPWLANPHRTSRP